MHIRPTSLVLLLVLACCGGGGGKSDGDVAVVPTTLTLGSGDVVLTLDDQARLIDVRVAGDPRNLAAGVPQPVLELDVAGETHLPETVSLAGDDLVVAFDGGAAAVRLDVTEAAGRLVLRVLDVQPASAEALRLRLALQRLSAVDPALNGTYDDDTILSLRSINARTRCIYRSLEGGVPQPSVAWEQGHGLVGGAAALVATSRAAFFPAMNALETAEGLPSPRFDGVAARLSATVRDSYLFLTAYRPGDVTKIIEAAQRAGLKRILLLRTLWRQSAGTYGIDTSIWPGGLPEFAAFCDTLRAAGLSVGLHLYGPSVSPDDPLVTPVPSPGLLSWDCPGLAAPIGAADDTLTLDAAPDLPPAGGGGYPGSYVRIDEEIVRYTGQQAGPPFAFTGCERGALGTTAGAHAAGAVPRQLATLHGMFLIDPDGPLVGALAANLAHVVNAVQADMVYYDGTALVPTNGFVQRWYYMNRILPAMYAAFDHPVIVQTGMGPGRELDWHLVPRSASADGHGDIKWYLDQRTPAINTILRGLAVPDIGWYGFDAGRPPDYLEYICAKALGWDCGISVQTYVSELDGDRRARETLEMIGRYERWKRAGTLPTALQDVLLTPGQDFRLLEDSGATPHLFEASYNPGLDVRTLPGGARAWTVGNSTGADRLLGIEITRGDAIRTHAAFTAGGALTLDALVDSGPYTPSATNDSARLVERVDKVVLAAGPARAGVSHSFLVVADAAVGGQALELSAQNGNRTIGWCAVGRVFDPVWDMNAQAATGLWIHGDGSGIELSIELFDDADQRTVVKVPLFFEGWRFHASPFIAPAAFDKSKVKYLVIVAADLPPEATVATRFALLRATPVVTPEADLTGVSVQVGARTVSLPAALPPGGTCRIDALGRLTIYPGGTAAGQTTNLAGGPLVLPPGTTHITFRAMGPAAYPGDVAVRTLRLKQVHP